MEGRAGGDHLFDEVAAGIAGIELVENAKACSECGNILSAYLMSDLRTFY